MRLQLRLKRFFDLLAAALIFLVAAPFSLLIALLIKLDDGGAVFFRHERLGLNAKKFRVWKFRTMLENADDLLDAQGAPSEARVTRVGRWLRFTSLDELPQVFNVLCGDMSIVGPRPVLPAHFDRYTERQKGRFAMRPGITGLAQIRGRNTLKWSKRIEADLEYIARFSLALDMLILLKTVPVVLFRRGVVLDRNPGQVDDLGNRA